MQSKPSIHVLSSTAGPQTNNYLLSFFARRKPNVITTKWSLCPNGMKNLNNFPKHLSYHHRVIKAIATCGLIFFPNYFNKCCWHSTQMGCIALHLIINCQNRFQLFSVLDACWTQNKIWYQPSKLVVLMPRLSFSYVL